MHLLACTRVVMKMRRRKNIYIAHSTSIKDKQITVSKITKMQNVWEFCDETKLQKLEWQSSHFGPHFLLKYAYAREMQLNDLLHLVDTVRCSKEYSYWYRVGMCASVHSSALHFVALRSAMDRPELQFAHARNVCVWVKLFLSWSLFPFGYYAHCTTMKQM